MLDLPGYDFAALVEKSAKSARHIYLRLSLLQLIPDVAEAFLQELITASHANLIARIPHESEGVAFEQFVFQPRTLATSPTLASGSMVNCTIRRFSAWLIVNAVEMRA